MLYQIFSMAGAILILGAFAAHQMNRMRTDRVAYQLLNLAGGVLLCITAVATRQVGFIVLEGSWAVISGIAVVRLVSGAANRNPPFTPPEP